MSQFRPTSCLVLVLALAFGCGGDAATDDADRDLSLPPAEAVTAINDNPEDDPPEAEAPEAEPAPPPRATPRPANPPEPTPRPTRPAPTPPVSPPSPDLGVGTTVLAFATDTLTSRHNKQGDAAMATVGEDLQDARGRVIIPAGAVLIGTITDIAPAETPGGQGRIVITYTQVSFDGQSYDIGLATDSMATHMKGRGVTVGDAAKVGAGAAIGAVAGRILGGNSRGTAVGAAAGAAAGVGIAAATRDVDILLDAGAPIFLTLSADFRLQPR